MSQNTQYVDGFVLVVPKDKIEEYREMAEEGALLWRKHGALDYKECVADDLVSNMMGTEILPFPKLVNLKPDETVVFSYVTYKSREHRDEVNAKVMKDPSMNSDKYKDKPMPFEMSRMSYGGFKVLVG
jgi:uncharacterized protein YbaA (DUF1428 family)